MRRTLFVLLLCAAALPTAPAAAAPKSTSYGGATRDGDPIVLAADAKALKLKSAGGAFTVRCPSGSGFPIAGALRVRPAPSGDAIPIGQLLAERNAGGRFKATMLAEVPVAEPNTAMLTITIEGRMNPRTASGTLTAGVAISNMQTGELVEACTLGPVKWTATHAPGRVFTGQTTRSEPVIAVVNAKRTMVTLFRFAWLADDCTPEGAFFQSGDSLTNLPLRRGRFGDSFSQRYALDDGGSIRVDYDVAIKVSRSKASGSVQVVITETAADGSETVCRAPKTTWKATSR
jgi:hypothetical protein